MPDKILIPAENDRRWFVKHTFFLIILTSVIKTLMASTWQAHNTCTFQIVTL